MCGPGYLFDPKSGSRMVVSEAGFRADLPYFQGKFYEVYPRAMGMTQEEAKRIGGMRFQFKLKPGACSGKPAQPQKSLKSPAPPRDEIRVPYRDPPSNKKAGPKGPFKEPPPSMPGFRPFEGLDGDGNTAQ